MNTKAFRVVKNKDTARLLLSLSKLVRLNASRTQILGCWVAPSHSVKMSKIKKKKISLNWLLPSFVLFFYSTSKLYTVLQASWLTDDCQPSKVVKLAISSSQSLSLGISWRWKYTDSSLEHFWKYKKIYINLKLYI